MPRRLAAAAALCGLAAVISTARVATVAVPGYAITGARLVTVSGKTLDAGTLVIRGGRIEEVTDGSKAPGGVEEIDGRGLVVYPGLIDLDSATGLDVASTEPPKDPETREVSERWRRQQLLRAQVLAADLLKADSPDLAKLTGIGITNALVVPPGEAIKGQSAFIDVVPPELDPQYGRVAADPAGGMILRARVALHVSIPGRGLFGAYPASLMGGIAFVRQALLDGQRYQLSTSRPQAAGQELEYDRATAAIGEAFANRLPVAFEANTPREIRRALAMAKEFALTPIVVGAQGAGEVVDDLKAASARAIVSLNFPERPKTLAPDADETLLAIEARANARKAAGQLAASGVPFGFGSSGLKDVKDFIPNVRLAVSQGLAPEAAIKALTLDAAALAGVGAKLGALERGRIANVVVTDGDLLAPKTKVKYVFVEGRKVLLP